MKDKVVMEFIDPEKWKENDLSKELIYRWNQIVSRSLYMNTPVGFQSSFEKEEFIQQWEIQRDTYRKSHTYEIVSSNIEGRGIVIGRDANIREIENYTEGNKNAKVVLFGMGGIGKTTLAKKVAEQLAEKYDMVLWLNYHMDLLHTICDDKQLPIENLCFSSSKFKNQKEYFGTKWRILVDLLTRRRVLLILDDMNNGRDRNLSMLWSLPCTIIVTSRICLEQWRVKKITVESLTKEKDWRAFYSAYGGEQISESKIQDLENYRKKVRGNTLLMRLATTNLNFQGDYGKDLESYFLRVNSLKPAEIQLLLFLSIMPVSGIEVKRVLAASGWNEEMIVKLSERSLVWMQGNGSTRVCGLHPVIAESVKKVYKPSQENCSRMLNGLAAYYTDIWNEPYEEEQKAISICFSILRTWPTLCAWLANAYDAFATVLWIGGYFDESLGYMKKLYQSCVDYYGERHQVTGTIALRVAAVYHNSLQFEKAKEWYDRGYLILNECEPYNTEYEKTRMSAAMKLARCERHAENYEVSMKYILEAEECSDYYQKKKTKNSQPDIGYFFVELEKAKILGAMGREKEVFPLLDELERNYKEEFAERYHLLAEINVFRAELYLKTGEIEKAIQTASQCMGSIQKRRGENAKETLGCMEVLADAFLAGEHFKEAEELYQKLLEKLSANYPMQKKWYQSIWEKESLVAGRP